MDDANKTQPPSYVGRKDKVSNPIADLMRQKVAAAYGHEPSATTEVQDLAKLATQAPRSKHQKFIEELTSSSMPMAEIQAAWHDYYANLADHEKHQVWQEFYSMHSGTPAATKTALPVAQPHSPRADAKSRFGKSKRHIEPIARTLADLRQQLAGSLAVRHKARRAKPVHSLLFGLGIGSIVLLIFLFGFFNERLIAPFIQPSRNIANTPLISDDTAFNTEPQIMIPKINVQIPVVYGIQTVEETTVNQGLENGVVHYADTALPGQNGNVVIIGHSSNNIFNKGKYKFAFVLLSRLDNGDTFYLQKDGKRYTYQVYQKKVIKPSDVSVLGAADKPATATLITCDPPGTSANRLVVLGQQISPDPGSNEPQVTQNILATQAASVPGDAPTLWSRLFKWLSS